MKYLDGQEGDEYLDSGLGDPSHFIGDDPNIEDVPPKPGLVPCAAATTWSSHIDGNPEATSLKIARDLCMQRIPVEADTMWRRSGLGPGTPDLDMKVEKINIITCTDECHGKAASNIPDFRTAGPQSLSHSTGPTEHAVLTPAKARRHSSAAMPRIGGPARSVVVSAAADPNMDDIVTLVDKAPLKLRAMLYKAILRLQAQVAARAVEMAALAKENMDTTAKLARTKQLLVATLYAAGVVNARSFLEHVVKMWRMEQPGGQQKKRVDVFKDGLKDRPKLVACLLRDVPSWAPAGMNEEKQVDSLANNLEAIFANTSNDIHTFNPAMGLMLVRAMHNGPTVAGLACLAEGVDVPCHIEGERPTPGCPAPIAAASIVVGVAGD
eukprot:XP_001693900.1 predicted protein [Chlamydomonas reinhardtii]